MMDRCTFNIDGEGRHHGPIGVALEDSDNRAYVDAIVDMAPNHLDTEFRDRLFEYTQGNSLFTLNSAQFAGARQSGAR
ncbi:hypothetical protein KFU94_30760 [Chloroflexi bacterium TSY]|nr:hypothetical protein [Chloroflexi bacterium TSY]